MRRIILSARTADPAWFDMSDRVGDGSHLFRCGDRAAAHLFLLEWRKRYPHRRLVVLDDPHPAGNVRELDSEWLYGGIADEIIQAEKAREPLSVPAGPNLYSRKLWLDWRQLRHRARGLFPTIRPKEYFQRQAASYRAQMGVPERYAVVQPLFDAMYEPWRGATPEWWGELCRLLKGHIPVMLVGAPANAAVLDQMPAHFRWYRLGMDVMGSLAAVETASLFVGAQTGLTLWAPMFDVPTVAAYRMPLGGRNGEAHPIRFRAPLAFCRIRGEVSQAAAAAAALLRK